MAGNTGKMTREAIIAKGPRMSLVKLYSGKDPIGMTIFKGNDSPVGLGVTTLKAPSFRTIAQSYSLNYLIQVAKGNR